MQAVKRMMRRDVTAVEVRPVFYELYNRWLERQMEGTAWQVSNNYYKSASGRIVTQWPFGAFLYGVLTKAVGPLTGCTRVAPPTAGWPSATPS